METKKVIRAQLLSKREQILAKDKKLWEEEIFRKLLLLPEYQNHDTLLLYVNYQSEVSTKKILEHSLKEKKRVFCPRVLSPQEMEFYEVKGMEDLKEGYRGILEPITTFAFSKNERALMILPLSAFDFLGNRLGYGKGYYDRYRQDCAHLSAVGLAFQCQLWEGILPAEDHDQKLDKVITQKQVYDFS